MFESDLDYFRLAVLIQIALVFLLFAHALVSDLMHLKKLTQGASRQIFLGRSCTSFGILLVLLASFVALLSRWGMDTVSQISVLNQTAMPFLVLGWGFAFRHRYKATLNG